MGMPLGPISEAAGGGRSLAVSADGHRFLEISAEVATGKIGVWVGRRIAETQAIHQAADSVEGLGDLLVLIIVIVC